MREKPASTGRVEVISGPMFSGKTEELLRRLRQADSSGLDTIAVKPEADIRHRRHEIVSHRGSRRAAIIVASGPELVDLSAHFAVIGLDEAHFLSTGLAESVAELRERGCRVIVDGLDRDYRRRLFPAIAAVSDQADELTRLEGVCQQCGRAATLTQRVIGGKPAARSGPTFLVGGPEMYEARCQVCYRKESRETRRVLRDEVWSS